MIYEDIFKETVLKLQPLAEEEFDARMKEKKLLSQFFKDMMAREVPRNMEAKVRVQCEIIAKASFAYWKKNPAKAEREAEAKIAEYNKVN